MIGRNSYEIKKVWYIEYPIDIENLSVRISKDEVDRSHSF